MKYTKMIKLAKSPAGGDFIVQKSVTFQMQCIAGQQLREQL